VNLQALFEKQKQLDDYIIQKKGLEGQELLPNKILALQVELGELANEWRGFKHWSIDQQPRYERKCHACKGIGAFGDSEPCLYCGGTGVEARPLLEEYIDCLHFILSIGLDLGVPDEYIVDLDDPFDPDEGDLTLQFMKVIALSTVEYPFSHAGDWFPLMEQFIALGELLGLTREQIEQAYNVKWEENVRRQDTGY